MAETELVLHPGLAVQHRLGLVGLGIVGHRTRAAVEWVDATRHVGARLGEVDHQVVGDLFLGGEGIVVTVAVGSRAHQVVLHRRDDAGGVVDLLRVDLVDAVIPGVAEAAREAEPVDADPVEVQRALGVGGLLAAEAPARLEAVRRAVAEVGREHAAVDLVGDAGALQVLRHVAIGIEVADRPDEQPGVVVAADLELVGVVGLAWRQEGHVAIAELVAAAVRVGFGEGGLLRDAAEPVGQAQDDAGEGVQREDVPEVDVADQGQVLEAVLGDVDEAVLLLAVEGFLVVVGRQGVAHGAAAAGQPLRLRHQRALDLVQDVDPLVHAGVHVHRDAVGDRLLAERAEVGRPGGCRKVVERIVQVAAAQELRGARLVHVEVFVDAVVVETAVLHLQPDAVQLLVHAVEAVVRPDLLGVALDAVRADRQAQRDVVGDEREVRHAGDLGAVVVAEIALDEGGIVGHVRVRRVDQHRTRRTGAAEQRALRAVQHLR